jgi:hypothetical protein
MGTSTGYNVVLVKYSASGEAQWVQTLSDGTSNSYFKSVAVDSYDNIYAAGLQYGKGNYTYGTISVMGTSNIYNIVLVKYNASGIAQWAQTMSAGEASQFNSVAIDSSDNIYTVGWQLGTGNYTYGSVWAYGTAGMNPMIVKYDSSGEAQWAKTLTAGDGASAFESVAVDSSGNVYAAGGQSGNGSNTFGTVTATGTSTIENVILVKYNSSGVAQWVQTLNAGTSQSKYLSVVTDSVGNIYAAGFQEGSDNYSYGSVSAQGKSNDRNIILVKYNSSGLAQWARTLDVWAVNNSFDCVAVDFQDNVYAVGEQVGTGSYAYGTVSATGGFGGTNAVLVKYQGR